MKILEIDGPPMAWFEVGGVRNVYKMIAYRGYDPDSLVKVMDNIIKKIKSELGDGVIYWRRRPEFFNFEKLESDDLYSICCRITTSPQLSQEFWESINYIKEEGADMKIHKGIEGED